MNNAAMRSSKGMRARWPWHARAETIGHRDLTAAEKEILECRPWSIRCIAKWIGEDLLRVMVTDHAHPMDQTDLAYRVSDGRGYTDLLCVYDGDPYDLLPELAYSMTAFDDPGDVEEARRKAPREQRLWVSGVFWMGDVIKWVDEFGDTVREMVVHCGDRQGVKEACEAFEEFRPFESVWWTEARRVGKYAGDEWGR
ncbi:hypothetical protein LTR86_003236 [Recurvomyces mirabilis]|nr:hypothetical protein LTR86_003236 [Recurvomyces mirabilis]